MPGQDEQLVSVEQHTIYTQAANQAIVVLTCGDTTEALLIAAADRLAASMLCASGTGQDISLPAA